MEKIIEENKMKVENLNEEKVRNETKVFELQEAIVSKEREAKICVENSRSEVVRLEKANISNASEVSRLLGTVEMKEKEIMKLENTIEYNINNEAEVNRLKNVIERKEVELQEKTEKITELQCNIRDCLGENVRLRTENTCLRNKMKVTSDKAQNTICGDTERVLGSSINSFEMAETINALTDAISEINTRLVKQEDILRAEQKLRIARESSAQQQQQPMPPKPTPRNLPIHTQTRPQPPIRSAPQMSVPPPPPPPLSAPQVPPPPLPPHPPSNLLPNLQQHIHPSGQPPKLQGPRTTYTSMFPTVHPGINQNQNHYTKPKLSTTMIITDSMSGKININQIKDNIDCSKEAVIFKRFPGHKAEEIAFYAPKPLKDCKPEQVVIVAGTNDLTQAHYQKGAIDEYDVVEGIMKIGRAAREEGAEKIYISGIMVRRGNQYRDAVSKVNELLYMTCLVENFVFMDQKDIVPSHISSDGLHLNYDGSTILKMNILSAFRTFDVNLINFKDDYEKVMY